jgi:hypothetical protein
MKLGKLYCCSRLVLTVLWPDDGVLATWTLTTMTIIISIWL